MTSSTGSRKTGVSAFLLRLERKDKCCGQPLAPRCRTNGYWPNGEIENPHRRKWLGTVNATTDWQPLLGFCQLRLWLLPRPGAPIPLSASAGFRPGRSERLHIVVVVIIPSRPNADAAVNATSNVV